MKKINKKTYFLVICTPPLNPFEKCPFPRPPANIWAFTTYSGTSEIQIRSQYTSIIDYSLSTTYWNRPVSFHRSTPPALGTFELRLRSLEATLCFDIQEDLNAASGCRWPETIYKNRWLFCGSHSLASFSSISHNLLISQYHRKHYHSLLMNCYYIEFQFLKENSCLNIMQA